MEMAFPLYEDIMQKELIIKKLKEKGCRMTRQRKLLLDIIFEGSCTCCKEIYYKAVKKDETIGMATVYRMVSTLEEIGAVSRNSVLGFPDCVSCGGNCGCRIEFEDGTVLSLPADKWREVIETGLKQCGYGKGKSLKTINEKETQ
jgi:Fur family ferric uptake transcriptional regulator